jgi:hypothetical protein
MLKRLNYSVLALAGMLLGVPLIMSQAADATKPTSAAGPTTAAAPVAANAIDLSGISDPAFDRHVDIVLLGSAWDQLDAALLTDCALQLAEGERILMRNHKAITSKQVLAIATKVAAEKRDIATLDRLASVCEGTKNTAILEQVVTAKKLSGQSRKIDPATSVSAIEVSPTQFAIYQEAVTGIKAAGIVGDASYFKNLEDGLNDKESMLANLSESQRSYLKKVMGETRELMPKESSQELSDTLAKLKGVSRQHGHHGGGHGIAAIAHGISHLVGGHGGGHHGGGHSGGHYGGHSFGGHSSHYPSQNWGHNHGQYYTPNYGHSHGHHHHGWHW